MGQRPADLPDQGAGVVLPQGHHAGGRGSPRGGPQAAGARNRSPREKGCGQTTGPSLFSGEGRDGCGRLRNLHAGDGGVHRGGIRRRREDARRKSQLPQVGPPPHRAGNRRRGLAHRLPHQPAGRADPGLRGGRSVEDVRRPDLRGRPGGGRHGPGHGGHHDRDHHGRPHGRSLCSGTGHHAGQ